MVYNVFGQYYIFVLFLTVCEVYAAFMFYMNLEIIARIVKWTSYFKSTVIKAKFQYRLFLILNTLIQSVHESKYIGYYWKRQYLIRICTIIGYKWKWKSHSNVAAKADITYNEIYKWEITSYNGMPSFVKRI